MPAGMYDFAMSAQAMEDGNTEVRWFIVSEDGVTYWHGGVHTDTTAQKTDLNGLAFSFRPEVEGVTGINLYGVEVSMGDAIELPEKPFSSFYVDAWGAIGNRLDGTGWTLDNDSTTLVGDAYLSGDGTSSNWTAIRGGFGGTQSATLEEALIVTGEFEIVGADVDEWNPFRWGLYSHEDIGSLNNQYTDSAAWGYTENEGTDSAAFVSNESMAYGYLAVNQTGSQQAVSGNGGSGSLHAVNGGSWISTYSGGTAPLGSPFSQAPRFAIMPAGNYEFAMSVQPNVDGTTEVRWYIVSDDGVSYWHGGVHTDTTAQKTDFNGIAFSFRPEVEGVTGINLYAVQIDRGAPIELPERPFSSFYVDAWGAIGNRLDATGWTLDNDSTTLVGDAYLSGEGTSSNWTAIRGGFGDTQFATEDEALIVTGQFEILGADVDEWNPFRWGLYEHQDIGTLNNQYTDSAAWGYTENEGTDSAAFVSNESMAYGYLVVNQTGTQQPVSGNGGSGSLHAVNGGSWISTFSGGTAPLGSPYSHAPRFAIMPAGTYDFAMSVQPNADGTTEVRWYMISEDGETYWHAGVHTDTTMQKTEFNGLAFSFRPEVEGVTGINLYEVQVDRGAPIEIPPAPFSSFYVDTWGFLGGKFGGVDEADSAWALTPGELVGDVTISGEAATGWAAVAGSFGLTVTPLEEAVTISGSVILDGGGFEDANSLRLGLFDQDLGSQDSTETVGWVFTGDETANGYLFVPGDGLPWADGQTGTAGGIAGGAWYDAEGDGAYGLSAATATGTPTAGTYELVMKAGPVEGGIGFRLTLNKDDGSYSYEAAAIDGSASKTLATSSFNSVVFATNNSSTTSLSIEALEVTLEEFSPVAIEDERDGSIPEVYALEQNYPNPFNPTTNIKFSLPEASNVELAVFNMLGQKVMTLVSGTMQPGFHQVTFDGKNLASGMYVYRIKAGDFVSTRKMMLIE
ncbi:MAG: T9SS type A sorting domain-containing protein, partial [Candidatus Latescibacterota bacterium]|jgi:hypothetical protein